MKWCFTWFFRGRLVSRGSPIISLIFHKIQLFLSEKDERFCCITTFIVSPLQSHHVKSCLQFLNSRLASKWRHELLSSHKCKRDESTLPTFSYEHKRLVWTSRVLTDKKVSKPDTHCGSNAKLWKNWKRDTKKDTFTVLGLLSSLDSVTEDSFVFTASLYCCRQPH